MKNPINNGYRLYTIKYRPYPNWGIWTVDRWFYPDELEKFKNEKEVVKITKRTMKWILKNCQLAWPGMNEDYQ